MSGIYRSFFTIHTPDGAKDVPAVVINRHSTKQDTFYPPNHPRHYIGRGTIYGNPFYSREFGGRQGSIARYREYAPTHQALMRRLPDLRGGVLVCSCKPQACHGDVLVELLSTYRDRQLREWTCET